MCRKRNIHLSAHPINNSAANPEESMSDIHKPNYLMGKLSRAIPKHVKTLRVWGTAGTCIRDASMSNMDHDHAKIRG